MLNYQQSQESILKYIVFGGIHILCAHLLVSHQTSSSTFL